MGAIENLIINWILEDQGRLGAFLAVLADEGDEEQGHAVMREIIAREIPHCGELWRDLMLQAIVGADWAAITTSLTDRRQGDSDSGAWVLVERRRQ